MLLLSYSVLLPLPFMLSGDLAVLRKMFIASVSSDGLLCDLRNRSFTTAGIQSITELREFSSLPLDFIQHKSKTQQTLLSFASLIFAQRVDRCEVEHYFGLSDFLASEALSGFAWQRFDR